ncbi:UPF0172-domain-containing protein [Dentipellis sp. KUC8613]|nr:UPF0172-domain-containing protein [Dentipellis sp. KUC8613]
MSSPPPATTYTLAPLAYTKLILHALKHPHTPANGVLLGTVSRSLTGTNAVAVDVAITDAVPLLHHWTSLSPMMEVGLELARGHAAAHNLTIVGYYQAAEHLHHTKHAHEAALAPVGERVAGMLRAACAEAVALVIDGDRIGETGVHPLVPYLPTSSSPSAPWHPIPVPVSPASTQATTQTQTPPQTPTPTLTLAPSQPARTLRLAREHGLQRLLGDFDDHLEDVGVDWLRNARVGEVLGEVGVGV